MTGQRRQDFQFWGWGRCPKREEEGKEEVAMRRRSRRSHDEQVTRAFALRAHMEQGQPGETQSASNKGSVAWKWKQC